MMRVKMKLETVARGLDPVEVAGILTDRIAARGEHGAPSPEPDTERRAYLAASRRVSVHSVDASVKSGGGPVTVTLSCLVEHSEAAPAMALVAMLVSGPIRLNPPVFKTVKIEWKPEPLTISL